MTSPDRRCWLPRFWDRLLSPPKRIRPMGLIAIQMSINPFELYWLVAICIVGVMYMVGVFPAPGSVEAILPLVGVRLWAINLGVGGLCALGGGLYRRNLEKGLALYQFGWTLQGVGCLVYGIAVGIALPGVGWGLTITNVSWAAACFTRALQVQRFFKLSQSLVRADKNRDAELQ